MKSAEIIVNNCTIVVVHEEDEIVFLRLRFAEDAIKKARRGKVEAFITFS